MLLKTGYLVALSNVVVRTADADAFIIVLINMEDLTPGINAYL